MNARGMGQTKLDHILASSHGADHFSVWSRDESTPYGSGVAIIGPRSMATTALKFGELPGYLLAYRFKRGDAGDLIIICIYLPHNNGDQRRQAVLAKLAEVTQELLDDDLVVVGGDFNAAFSPSEDRDPTTVETNNDDDSNDDDNDDDDELSQEELIARTRTDPECEIERTQRPPGRPRSRGNDAPCNAGMA
ncbi:hypothetical protein BC828DRAFT_394694 [Blastocladiella britannica]|nr:hypothetical protein BC828DRAFT_394694 [Blastocladiella britannica]